MHIIIEKKQVFEWKFIIQLTNKFQAFNYLHPISGTENHCGSVFVLIQNCVNNSHCNDNNYYYGIARFYNSTPLSTNVVSAKFSKPMEIPGMAMLPVLHTEHKTPVSSNPRNSSSIYIAPMQNHTARAKLLLVLNKFLPLKQGKGNESNIKS